MLFRSQGRALRALEAAAADGEWVVRYAVVVGLESLGAQLGAAEAALQEVLAILQPLQAAPEPVLVVQLRARQAVERLSR